MGFLAPIFGAIGAAIGSLGFIGKAIIGIGLNLLVGVLTKKEQKKATPSGTQFDRDYGENVSRKVACGLVGIAGHDCYVNTWGSSNKQLEQIYAFSDFPCDGLSKIWAGGKELTLQVTATDSVKTAYAVIGGDYAGLMTFTFYNGTQTTADDGLITHSNPVGRWTVDHIGTGICFIIARLTYDQEKLGSFPDFFFELRGARLYDPRKDSTVGGVGAHRWDDYSTYEFSENPIVQEYNYRRGFSINDDMFCGMGMDAIDLPLDRYFTAMNFCDETVEGEARYRCSIVFDCDVEHGDNIQSVMVSCGGIVIDSVEGSWPLIGSDQPVVETFTDDDVVKGENPRFQRRRSMADLVNAVSGTYPEPSNMWSPAGYDTQTNAGYVALDRRSRDINLELPTVRSKRQANQLASIYFNENRYEATADIVLRPRFQTIKAGDWVRWNSARYGDRIYMVQARSIKALTSDGPRNVVLSLQERDGAIYDAVTVIPPVIPVPNGEPVYLNELQDFTIIPVLSVGADGRSYPAFRASWSAIDDPTVTGIVIEWWIEGEPENKFSRQVAADQTLAFLQEGVVSLTFYQFSHRLIADRPTTSSSPITVKSLDGGNADLEVGLGNLKQEVKDVFTELYASLNRNETRLAQIQQNLQITGGVSQSIGRRLEVSGAKFDEQITVLSSDIASVVDQTTELIAQFGENLADGLVAFQAVAAPAGVTVRYAILLKGSIGDTFKQSGFFVELYTDAGVLKSRVAIDADQFVVTDSDNNNALPLIFEDGQLKLQVANIGTITAGLINAGSGKSVYDVDAGILEFYD